MNCVAGLGHRELARRDAADADAIDTSRCRYRYTPKHVCVAKTLLSLGWDTAIKRKLPLFSDNSHVLIGRILHINKCGAQKSVRSTDSINSTTKIIRCDDNGDDMDISDIDLPSLWQGER